MMCKGPSPWVSRTSTWAPSSAMPGGLYVRSNGVQLTVVQISTSKGELKAGTSEREVVISGTRESVDAVEAMIVQRVSDAANSRCRQQGGGGGERRPVKEVE